MSKIDNPFDGAANRRMVELGESEAVAVDTVVFEHLLAGDTRALAHWLAEGTILSRRVQIVLSVMLQPSRNKDAVSLDSVELFKENIPFRLKAVRRSGRKGSKTNPVSLERNRAICDRYDGRMVELGPGCHEAVIDEIAGDLAADMRKETIRDIIKTRSRKPLSGE